MTITCTMILGDCLEVMPELPRGCGHIAFADLPYGVHDSKWDSPIDLVALWKGLSWVCHKNALMLFTSIQPFTTSLINSNSRAFKYDLVWRKGQATGFLNAKKSPLRIHESLLVFGGTVYNPQMWDAGVCRHGNGKRANKSTHSETYTRIRDNGRSATDRYPLSVVDIRDRENRRHSAQKPVALIDWLIRTYSNSGNDVLDPVSGSGTTAVSAIQNGRNVTCIEKDAGYFEASIERVRKTIADNKLNVTLEVRK